MTSVMSQYFFGMQILIDFCTRQKYANSDKFFAQKSTFQKGNFLCFLNKYKECQATEDGKT